MIELDQINWGTVQNATNIVVHAVFLSHRFERHELQNECIDYILSDNKRAARLQKYIWGEQTQEKVNKLAFALIQDRSWLADLHHKSGSPFFETRHFEEQSDGEKHGSGTEFKTLGIDELKALVWKYYAGEGIHTEEAALVVDYIENGLTEKQKAVIQAVYRDGMSTKQLESVIGISRRSVDRLRQRGFESLQRVLIPLYARGR